MGRVQTSVHLASRRAAQATARTKQSATALPYDGLRWANSTLLPSDPQRSASKACSGRQTWTGDAKNASSARDVDVRCLAAVAARVRLAGRSAHDASTSARKTSGATMSAALSPTAARENLLEKIHSAKLVSFKLTASTNP